MASFHGDYDYERWYVKENWMAMAYFKAVRKANNLTAICELNV
jgi:hypothetical protein